MLQVRRKLAEVTLPKPVKASVQTPAEPAATPATTR
jgi:hypothetical protein